MSLQFRNSGGCSSQNGEGATVGREEGSGDAAVRPRMSRFGSLWVPSANALLAFVVLLRAGWMAHAARQVSEASRSSYPAWCILEAVRAQRAPGERYARDVEELLDGLPAADAEGIRSWLLGIPGELPRRSRSGATDRRNGNLASTLTNPMSRLGQWAAMNATQPWRVGVVDSRRPGRTSGSLGGHACL